MGHTVGKAAENATRKGMAQTQKSSFTQEQAIAEIRNLRLSHLFVSNLELVDKLLAAYDELSNRNGELQRLCDTVYQGNLVLQEEQNRLLGEMAELNESNAKIALTTVEQTVEIARLQEQIEQFRTVYEQENRSQTLKLERAADSSASVQLYPCGCSVPLGINLPTYCPEHGSSVSTSATEPSMSL
jgi:hypothetical protein